MFLFHQVTFVLHEIKGVLTNIRSILSNGTQRFFRNWRFFPSGLLMLIVVMTTANSTRMETLLSYSLTVPVQETRAVLRRPSGFHSNGGRHFRGHDNTRDNV